MKRSEALIPLSHDHHHALFVAKLLRDARAGDTPADEAAAAFRSFWLDEGREHFRIEEEVLLPGSGLEGPASDPGVARMLDDHLEIRRMAEPVINGETDPAALSGLGELLTAHVRFEERELFPRIESKLDAPRLQKLARAIAEASGEGNAEA